jgi:hypothetical protein
VIERMCKLVALAGALASAGCFGDPAPSDTGPSTSAAATGSSSVATTSSAQSDADTSTPSDTTTTVAATSDGTTGSDPSTTDPGGTDSSTGGEPRWVIECAELGLTIDPIPPAAARRWQVSFTYDQPLTEISLGVAGGDEMPDTASGPGCAPSCTWTWMFIGGEFPPGPTDLTIKSERVTDIVECTIVLE